MNQANKRAAIVSTLTALLLSAVTVAACGDSSTNSSTSSCSCKVTINGTSKDLSCGQSACFGTTQYSCSTGAEIGNMPGAKACDGTTTSNSDAAAVQSPFKATFTIDGKSVTCSYAVFNRAASNIRASDCTDPKIDVIVLERENGFGSYTCGWYTPTTKIPDSVRIEYVDGTRVRSGAQQSDLCDITWGNDAATGAVRFNVPSAQLRATAGATIVALSGSGLGRTE